MSFGKKIGISFLVISLSASLLSSLPLGSQHAGLHKLAFTTAVNAASQPNLDNFFKLHEALDAADSEDLTAVDNLKNEIASLDDTADQTLIDPVWNKISAKLPSYVDQEKVKTDLFRLLKALRIYLLDPQESELEAIRTNSDFNAALQTISAAAGQPSLTINDFLLFLFGDADQLKGVEGSLKDTLHNMDPHSIATHIHNKQQAKDLLFQETEKVLALTEKYQVSQVLRNLGVNAQDVQELKRNFENRLQFDDPAFVAFAIAYIRSDAALIESHYRNDPPYKSSFTYSWGVFGWLMGSYDNLKVTLTKVSGSPDLEVTSLSMSGGGPIGWVKILEPARSGSAVVQVKLLNPFGGSEKVIVEQELSLKIEEPRFDPDRYFNRKGNTLEALRLGEPSDMEAVNKIRAEVAALDETADLNMIDPVWNKIEALFLPEEREQAKRTLFLLFKDMALLHYDPKRSDYERITTNPEYINLLYKITNIQYEFQVEHFLILIFGEANELAGFSGAFRQSIRGAAVSYDSSDLTSLVYDDNRRNEALIDAVKDTFRSYSYSEYHQILPSLVRHHITAEDFIAVYNNFKSKLEHMNEADRAMLLAYLRYHTQFFYDVSYDESEQRNSLHIFYNEFPMGGLTWIKASGSSAITVTPEGTATLSKFVSEASAVIQAVFVDPHTGKNYVLAEKEITLKNKRGSIVPQHLLNRFNALSSALHAGPPEEVQAVRTLQEEIAAFDNSSLEALMNPVWKKINAKLPAHVNKAQLKSSLLQMFKTFSSFMLDPQVSQLESIYTNPEYLTAIQAIGTAGGNPNLGLNDLFILLYGNGGSAKGIEGAIREVIFSKSPQELSSFVDNPLEQQAVLTEAITNELLHNSSYALIPVLSKLDITPIDVLAALLGLQFQLDNNEPAIQALIKAYIRSEALQGSH